MKRTLLEAAFAPVCIWFIVGLSCGLPLLWISWQMVSNSTTSSEMRLDLFRLQLLWRTIFYNVMVALVATLMAIPAAITLGRGRGIFASSLWFVLPMGLLLPSLVLGYGWSQLFRLIDATFEPASTLDIARCIWSLATWLCPVPAIAMGLALRRSDSQVQMQALLDGVRWRAMLREMLSPAIASIGIVSILAMQEFAVYEPTGISVVATEVRMVFETGAFSSPENPITQPMSQAQGSRSPGFGLPDQRARAAAAVATAFPLIVVIAILASIALIASRKLRTSEYVETGVWPLALDAPGWIVSLSWCVIAITLLAPVAAMILSLKRPLDPARIWNEFGPQMKGSMVVSSLAGAVGLLLAMSGAIARVRGATIVALASFLIGGQLIAIALIRLYNRPHLSWMYSGVPIILMAYMSRFGWIALVAAGTTFSGPWRALREMACLDGADRMQTARQVIWPLAWPTLLAAAAFVMVLSLSEVPATVLIVPQHPQVLIPMLMTWVHLLRYDAMIEGSLLMVGIVVVVGTIAVFLAYFGKSQIQRYNRQTNLKSQISNLKFGSWILFVSCILVLGTSGCGPRTQPDDVWLETGNGPAQTVYPRAIAYSSTDDSFFIVDRQARIQHLDHHGKFITEWQTPQWAQGKPVGLSVGPDGNLYVPDTHYHRVLVYKPNGEGPIRRWGTFGSGPGQFIYPTDIAFDSRGRIFVSEYGDHDRIQVFDPDGNYLYEFGKFGSGPGEFSRPQSMVIDRDVVYITDACNHRIAVFKTDGTFIRNLGGVGSELGQFRFPYGLAMDSKGMLIVCEFGNNRVQRIDPQTGNGLATWGLAGREPGELAYPWGVAVDKHDRVVAVDAGNNRLQVFEF